MESKHVLFVKLIPMESKQTHISCYYHPLCVSVNKKIVKFVSFFVECENVAQMKKCESAILTLAWVMRLVKSCCTKDMVSSATAVDACPRSKLVRE